MPPISTTRANEVSLSNTLAIVSLKLVICDFSLPFRRSIDSCQVDSSSFKVLIRFVMLLSLDHRKLWDTPRIPLAFDAL